MKPALIILNTTSGAGQGGRIRPQLESSLAREGIRYELVWQESLEGLAAQARQGVAAGHQLVVAVGGDGTVREVARGIAGSEAVFGIVPAGTGNGTAASLGLPLDPGQACRVLARGVPRRVDLGQSSRGPFLNLAGVGLDARIAREYRQQPRFLPGLPGYVLAALRSLPDFRPARLTVSLDAVPRTLRGMLVVVGNGRYYGKGVRIAPEADPGDGEFHVYLVEEADLAEVAALAMMLLLGRVARHPLVHVYRARQVLVEGAEKLLVHLDGDVVGETPVSFDILSGRLKVMVPASGSLDRERGE